MNDRLTINLQIGGTNFRLLNIERSQESYFRNAAEQINKKLNLYRQKFAQESIERVLTMVALDFAYSNEKSKDMNDTEPFRKKIEELDAILAQAEAEK